MLSSARPPVLVMGPSKYVGPLGVMRSLGHLGIRVYGLTHRRPSLATTSRYCAGTVDVGADGRPVGEPAALLAELLRAGRKLGQGTILIPASDEWAVFVAEHAETLSRIFLFPRNPAALVQRLAAKDGLCELAGLHGLPTPRLTVPRNRTQVAELAANLTYPVILKPVASRPGLIAKAVATDRASLLTWYRILEDDPNHPNVSFQEYIPVRDEDVWMFNGYFDRHSRCLAAFTGTKLRQHPIHMGVACLAVCRHNPALIELTSRFLAEVGYSGIVDVDYVYDRRDGRYKVVDVNPRLGGVFRLFVDANGLDVVRALYLDLTGLEVPEVAPKGGRRWLKEDSDLIALKHYRRQEGLRLRDWLRSLRGVEEGATFALDDPIPFLVCLFQLAHKTFQGRWARRSSRWRLAYRLPGFNPKKAEEKVA